MKKYVLGSLLLLLYGLNGTVQGQITNADYERADTSTRNAKLVYNAPVVPKWIGKTGEFWYVNHERMGDVCYIVNALKRTKRKAFDTNSFRMLIRRQTGKDIGKGRLPIYNMWFSDASTLRFTYDDLRWEYNIKDYRLKSFTPFRNRRPQNDSITPSPNKQWEIIGRDYNLFLRRTQTGETVPLTLDGTKDNYYDAQVIWSGNSQKIATLRVQPVEIRKIPLIESSPAGEVQPKLRMINYSKPGDSLPVRMPVLFDIPTKRQIPIETESYKKQFSLQLTGWREDSRAFTFEFNERGHQRFIVGEVDAKDGKVKHLVDEKCSTFFYYNNRYRKDLYDGKEMLWISERDGWRHLYLIEGATGKVKRQVTKGEWVVRKVLHVDPEQSLIYFTASGLYPGEDPYNLHCCRIRLDGSEFKDLTPENGNHEITFSPDFTYFVDACSRPNLPGESWLRRASNGKVVMVLERCDIQELKATGWTMPEVFHAKGRDGKTDIWGTIFRPSHFDPTRRYPVVEKIYAGPHDSFVDKNFSAYGNNIARLTELGFIVVTIDGMGTSNRSKAFHDVCWKNLRDSGFPDRILWIKAAAAQYPYMDISNVGIYGWSAGGQSAMGALLFFNDFYKVAVSLCGCHDNRIDKLWWNEQWLGYPVDESYLENSNVVNAFRLKGKLLLINGEIDDNVDPASTLQVVNALMKAHKNFDQLYLPGRSHALNGYTEMRKMQDFFVRHIMCQEPPEWK